MLELRPFLSMLPDITLCMPWLVDSGFLVYVVAWLLFLSGTPDPGFSIRHYTPEAWRMHLLANFCLEDWIVFCDLEEVRELRLDSLVDYGCSLDIAPSGCHSALAVACLKAFFPIKIWLGAVILLPS